MTLIDTIALLHQHQREVHTTREGDALIEYVEVTLEDIAMANQLAHEVLGRSLDELPPHTRRLLLLIDEHVRSACEPQALPRSAYRFSRRQLREALGWSDAQLRVHLERLVELEYLIAHRDGPGGKFVYELLYDGQGQDGEAFLSGLIEVEALRGATGDFELAGSGVRTRRAVAGRSRLGCGGSRDSQSAAELISTPLSGESAASHPKPHE